MMSGGFGGSGRIPRPTCAMGRGREAEDDEGAGKGGFTLFGVHLAADSPPAARPAAPAHDLMMRKSFSMGNLSNYGCPDGASPPSPSPFEQPDSLGSDPRRGDTLARPVGGGSGGDGAAGYASDDLVHATSSSSIRERKKGIPWTEEEHRLFLLGLQKLGKGDWRGISKNFVKTRTPTQVASHAQKYFLRKNNLSKRRRRSSLFDITQENVSSLLDEAVSEEPEFEHVDVCPELTLGQSILHGGDRSIHASMLSRPANNMEEFSTSRPSLPVSCAPVNALKISKNTKKEHKKGIRDSEVCGMDIVGDKVFVHQSPMDISETDCNASIKGGASQSGFQFPLPALWPWPLAAQMHLPWSSSSKIVKPTPILPTPRLSTNDIVKLPEPSVNGARPVMEPTPLSYKLSKEGSRNSAFHTMASATNSELDTQGNLSNAISVP